MTGVGADLATLREWTYRIDAGRTVARVEAELSRLREERDGTERARKAERVGRKAAEARCARLQQALREIEAASHVGPNAMTREGLIAREALAGPGTPADSQEDKT